MVCTYIANLDYQLAIFAKKTECDINSSFRIRVKSQYCALCLIDNLYEKLNQEMSLSKQGQRLDKVMRSFNSL